MKALASLFLLVLVAQAMPTSSLASTSAELTNESIRRLEKICTDSLGIPIELPREKRGKWFWEGNIQDGFDDTDIDSVAEYHHLKWFCEVGLAYVDQLVRDELLKIGVQGGLSILVDKIIIRPASIFREKAIYRSKEELKILEFHLERDFLFRITDYLGDYIDVDELVSDLISEYEAFLARGPQENN